MKVALCVIGRMENRYAVEYVEHYKGLGFDKIFVYDNNFGDEEHFEEVLQPYVDEGFVEIVNFRDIAAGIVVGRYFCCRHPSRRASCKNHCKTCNSEKTNCHGNSSFKHLPSRA